VFKVSNKKRIKVKVLCPGEFSAPALITRERISLLGNADPERGVFCDPKSELKGSSFAGKALIFTSGKGSTLWTFLLSASRQKGTHPAGIINTELDTLVVWGCVVNDIPLVQIKDQSIFEKVKNGDLVTLDPANEEIVIG
jgi:predicted aconitase with swiveling domain